jgi:hypothetical protein
MSPSQIVQKLWNYCDDGMSYGDYVEQLKYLLFLKMADERSKPPYNLPSPIPKVYDWQSLLKKDGDELLTITVIYLKNLVGEGVKCRYSSMLMHFPV